MFGIQHRMRFFASEAAEPSAVIIFRPNNFAIQKYVINFAQTNKKSTKYDTTSRKA